MVRRVPVVELAADPFRERLTGAPSAPPSSRESSHDRARRALIAEPGQWVVLNARVRLNEASARRLARSYQRAKPARLLAQATGRFTARAFLRDGVWLVAAAYRPGDDPSPSG